MANNDSTLSKLLTDLFIDEQSVLHILKRTKHIVRLKKWLSRDLKKISPVLTPYIHKLADDYEHEIYSKNLGITKASLILRIENPAAEGFKKIWSWLIESSDDEVDEDEYESAREDFEGEEEKSDEEGLEDALETIISLSK